jgi:hypothetical protein
MKFLVPNYSCLQNPWRGGYRPQIPVLSVLCPQLNLLNPHPEQNSWVRHWSHLKIPGAKWVTTPILHWGRMDIRRQSAWRCGDLANGAPSTGPIVFIVRPQVEDTWSAAVSWSLGDCYEVLQTDSWGRWRKRQEAARFVHTLPWRSNQGRCDRLGMLHACKCIQNCGWETRKE